MSTERRERVFLVRLWRAGDPAGEHAWRGSVHDVTFGPKRFVTGSQEIADFVALRLRATDDDRLSLSGDGLVSSPEEQPDTGG